MVIKFDSEGEMWLVFFAMIFTLIGFIVVLTH